MKTIKFLSTLAAITLVAVFFVRCTEEAEHVEPVMNYGISGTVTYPDYNGSSTTADGAVVYLKLNATEATASYDMVTIADGTGKYTFLEIPDGSHFVFANYDTQNTNNAGRIAGVIFGGEGALVELAGAIATQDLALVSMGQADAFAVNTYEGGDWGQDWNHSVVGFEFPYDEHNALFNGRFKANEIYVDFDPFSLATSKIEATIDLLTIITDSPGGRDPKYDTDGSLWQDVDLSYKLGCIAGTFGISLPTDAVRYATFKTTSIEAYGDGYLATGPMVFNGATHEVSMFFKFVPGFVGEDRSGNPVQYSSFQGSFEFAALSDFGLDSGHIGTNNVTVTASFQVKKTL